MPCYSPLSGFYSKVKNASGKRSVVFSRNEGLVDFPLDVPCGRCIGCRLECSRQWAVRCVHEASLHAQNCFITLTFSDKFLDPKGSLVKSDFQSFMKRLRRYVAPVVAASCFLGPKGRLRVERYSKPFGVRYFHCGEYGEQLGRPHHHACLFGFDFSDKVFWKMSGDGVSRLYRSAILESLWPFGFCTIGDVTFESAAYVARYVVKKLLGCGEDELKSHYGNRIPEYVTMSRRPGIASGWFDRFSGDVFPGDFVVSRGGVKCKPPRYYFEKFSFLDPVSHGRILHERKRRAVADPDNEFDRLAVREFIQEERVKQLKRGM